MDNNNKVEYIGEDGSKIIFDPVTYYKIALSCIQKFGHKSREESIKIIDSSSFFNKKKFPPRTYNEMALLDNELIYDIAMMVLYGDEYWNHPNYSKIGMDEYYEWENGLIRENNLNQEYIDYQ